MRPDSELRAAGRSERPDRRLELTLVYVAAIVTAGAGAWLTSLSPLVPWAILAAAALAYLVLARPEFFALVLIAILPWQGALRFPTHSVTIVKLVGALLFLSVLLSTLMTDRRLKLTPVIGWAVLLCTAVTLSLLINGLGGLSVTEALRYWNLTLFLFLIVQLIDSHESFLRAIRVLALSAMVGAIWASVQFLSGSVLRASGPISDPNDFAYLLAAVLPFVAYLFVTERARRWLWGAGLLCLSLGILGSSSRGAFVALGVTGLWAISTRRLAPSVVLGALTTVVLSTLLALGISSTRTSQNLHVRERGLSTSVSLRKVYWSAAVRMSADHPVVGIGPGRFQQVSPGYVRNTPVLEKEVAVNNTYLSILTEDGAIAALLFLVFLLAIWRQILLATQHRGPPRSPRAPENWLRNAFLASFILALVGGVFFSAELSTPFWIIAAFACTLKFQAYRPAGEPS
jgi:putative inorganic carbon (HCO3(-)) transporter